MYIAFDLPQSGAYTATLGALKIAIARWAERYQIPYTQKTIKFTHRLGFNRDEYFSLFSMTWDWDYEFRIVNIENERY